MEVKGVKQMGELRTIFLSVLGFLAIFVGLFTTANQWYAFAGVTANLDNATVFNTSATGHSPNYYMNYINNWNNDTSRLMATAQSVPYLGGAFMVTVGVFQALTLAIGIPTNVLIPMVTDIGGYTGIPTWAVSFVTAALLVYALIAIANAMKGGAM